MKKLMGIHTCISKILAVKGIGGYLLLADASNKDAISLLRERKHRKKKPFAIISPDDNYTKKIANVSNAELEAINSKEAEIVLLNASENINKHIAFELIAPGLSKIGVMKPYAPLLKLIANNFNKALIATSANISGSPIIYSNQQAKDYLSNIADYIVLNNRDILIPQDDSVSQFTKGDRKIILRRSRGLAPNFFADKIELNDTILATGAMMKSSFAFYTNRQFYISQYLGNTDFFDSQRAYINTYKHIKSVLKANINTVLCDKHPAYFSTEFARQLSDKHSIELHEVQHHKAHFASVIGENNLCDENVLGFVWDGTGYGDDKNIWGGEVFELKNNNIERVYHLDYSRHILMDKMPKEPRISALSHFAGTRESENFLKNKFNEIEWSLYNKKASESNLLNSSMGRLFDAVASILNLCDINDYEAQAAMLLEAKAREFVDKTNSAISYSVELEGDKIILNKLKQELIDDLHGGISKAKIALKFHLSLVEIIRMVSEAKNINKLAFSGGVFQNALLVELIEGRLNDKNLYFHKQLSPNDENISHGQIISYYLTEKTKTENSELNKEYHLK